MAERFVVEHDRFGGEYERPTSYKFGEALQFEKVTGITLEEGAKPGLRSMMGELYIAIRRVHPEFTWADLEDVDMGGISQPDDDDEAPADPTQPAQVDADVEASPNDD